MPASSSSRSTQFKARALFVDFLAHRIHTIAFIAAHAGLPDQCGEGDGAVSLIGHTIALAIIGREVDHFLSTAIKPVSSDCIAGAFLRSFLMPGDLLQVIGKSVVRKVYRPAPIDGLVGSYAVPSLGLIGVGHRHFIFQHCIRGFQILVFIASFDLAAQLAFGCGLGIAVSADFSNDIVRAHRQSFDDDPLIMRQQHLSPGAVSIQSEGTRIACDPGF